MMSQTHILVASALMAKPGQKLRNTAILIGAFVPDAAIYSLFVWSKLRGIDENKVWNELYWQEPWQTYTAAGNSVLLYVVLMLIGAVALRNAPAAHRIGLFLMFLSLAALTHLAGDFPVHVDDAHRHLWPLSDWKFISPVSYWDPNHHGTIFSIFEALLGVVLCVILFRRFDSWLVRIPLIVLVAAYVLVPLYFAYQLQGHEHAAL